jgi:hypothetical protein
MGSWSLSLSLLIIIILYIIIVLKIIIGRENRIIDSVLRNPV